MSLVNIEIREGVAVVSLNRPEKHNAVNDEMNVAIRDSVTEAMNDDDVRCILLRGEGKSFSSGKDVASFSTELEAGGIGYPGLRHRREFTLAFLDTPKPTVAAMKGYVLGGGFERCLACDIRIGSTDLVCSLPEIDFGLVPDSGGTQLLTTLVGPARAKEMVLTGRRIDAQTALDWGIVNRLVSPERLDEETFALCKNLASKPPVAIKIAKDLVGDVWAGQLRSGIRRELLGISVLFESEDHAEATRARREKRPPTFKGK